MLLLGKTNQSNELNFEALIYLMGHLKHFHFQCPKDCFERAFLSVALIYMVG